MATTLKFPLIPRWLRWLAVGVVASTIVYFSLMVTPPAPPQGVPAFWDKELHFLAYGSLTLVAAYATVEYRDRPVRRWIAIVLAVALFSGSIELLQGLVSRYPSLLDFAANLFGTGVASIWFLLESQVTYRQIRSE